MKTFASGKQLLKDRIDTWCWELAYRLQTRRGVQLDATDSHQESVRIPESEFSIGAECTDQELPDDFQAFVRSYRPCPRVVRRFENAVLAGERGLVFTQTGHPIVQITRPDAVLRRKLSNLSASRLSALRNLVLSPPAPVQSLNGLYYSMVYLWSDNYYHWIVEFLPGLRALEQFESNTGERPAVLIQPNPPDWMRESLQFAGISADRIQEWSGRPTRVSELLLSNHRITTGGQHGSYDLSVDDHRWVRETVLSNLENPDDEAQERIYVSRQRTKRHVGNFDEVIDVLEEYGFEQYVLEEMPFGEQVRLFDAADCIVAPHGAGLVNILFAPSSASVLELLPGPRSNANFFRVAAMLDQEYSYIDCGTSYDPESFTVDTDRLTEWLERQTVTE